MKKLFSGLLVWLLLTGSGHAQTVFTPREVYRSSKLVLLQLAENSFQHISYKQTNDFGNVPCNGLLVKSRDEAIVFDTPTNDSAATELIRWIQDSLHCRINAVVPTHFHDDCLGGLGAFHLQKIPSYASQRTLALAGLNKLPVPQQGFTDSLVLKFGDQFILARYFGEGHTVDNIVGYFPGDRILFGGCMVKEMDASKGYLGDANLAAWPGTVQKVQKAFPDARIVVPGHGDPGGRALLDYTIRLFSAQ